MCLFSWQYSLAANAIRDIEECEQAHELGAINSTLRYVVNSHTESISLKHYIILVKALLECLCLCIENLWVLYSCLIFCP